MKKISILLALLLLPIIVTSQQVDLSKFKELAPRNIGPAGMSGRVTAIDVNLSNTADIYVGTASGGLWYSPNDGITWEPLTEELPTQSIGDVKIQQSNPDVIWLGTGEGNPRNSQSSGNGIYKSIDGGRTWTHLGLEKSRNIHRIIIHRDNPDIVYVGAQGPAWGETEERGVFRTTDGGKSWKKVLYVNEKTGIADLIVDPSNPNKMFAAMWEFRRWPWFFKSGGEGSGLYMTLDGGDTWKELTDEDGLPKGELGRIGLAISQSNRDIVYALVEAKDNGFYKSTDGGFTWRNQQTENIGGRPFYYADIRVDPWNENRIYNVHSVIDKSEDGGKSFQNMIAYYADGVHPDHHAFWINPNNPNHIIDGNDGGLAISKDRGANWRFVENLPVAQFYHISVDNEVPYRVYGGMQDNGSWIGPSSVWRSGGIRNAYWEELRFGDGFDVVPDPSDNRYGYAMAQGGSLGRYDLETGGTNFIKPVHPDDSITLRFNWNAAISADPFDNKTVYYGSQYLHKSTDRGENWEIISPDLTTNNPEYQKQDSSGGLTFDATGAENFTTILAIAPSTLNDKMIWVTTDDGNIQLTTDDGNSWQNKTGNLGGAPKGSWIPQIRPSRYNESECYVVVNDYRRNNWEPYLLFTNNKGDSWTNLLKGKEIGSYVISFIQDPIEPNLMFLGTEFGLYISFNQGKDWQKWTEGYPSVPTMDMEIQERENDLVIGTFGRAAWIFDDISAFREVAKEGADILEKPLTLFPVNTGYMVSTKQPAGTRFGGKSMYDGTNERMGVRFTFNINKPKSKKKEKKKDIDDDDTEDKKKDKGPSKDSLTVRIYDISGKEVRTLFMKVDTAIQRYYWGFETNGIRGPGSKKPENETTPPGSISVLPGKYKAVFTYMNTSDSAEFTVENDPRVEYNMSDLVAVQSMYKELEANISNATEAMDKVNEAEEKLGIYEKIMEANKDLEKDSLSKRTKSIKDSIESIKIYLRGKGGLKGIVRREDTYNHHSGYAQYYLGSAMGSPNSTQRIMAERIERMTNELVSKVNKFLENEWADYQSYIQKLDFELFKKIEKVKK